MFLHTVGHNIRNRVVGANFGRSGEVVSRYFQRALHAIGELRDDLIRKPSLETQTKIEGNYRWDPYFKDCIEANEAAHRCAKQAYVIRKRNTLEDFKRKCLAHVGRETLTNLPEYCPYELLYVFFLKTW